MTMRLHGGALPQIPAPTVAMMHSLACGGTSAFTGGAFRVVYHGSEDLARLIPDMNETELSDVDFGTYTEEQYFDDMGRLTQYRCDPDMTEILIRSSFDAGVWMRSKGVR